MEELKEARRRAQKIDCVNHVMVEQFNSSVMETQSNLCFTLCWSSDWEMAQIHLLQTRVLQSIVHWLKRKLL